MARVGTTVSSVTIQESRSLKCILQIKPDSHKLVKKSANAIPELAEDISSSVQIQANRLSTSTLQNWDETVDRLREAIAIGIDATQRESQSLNKKNTVDVSSTTDSINPLTEKIERL